MNKHASIISYLNGASFNKQAGTPSLDVLPSKLRKVYDTTPTFSEKGFQRKLTPEEITSASKDLNVDFASKGLVPLYDKGDNDFVVYNPSTKQLEMFNIADELSFMQGAPTHKLVSKK